MAIASMPELVLLAKTFELLSHPTSALHFAILNLDQVRNKGCIYIYATS